MKLKSPNLLLLSLLLGLLLALTTQAQAQQPEEKANTCPNWQPNQLPTSQAQWQAEYQRLNPLFNACLHSADFLAYYGAIQLRTGKANQALDTLERALLLNPNHGAAQLDYTQALLHTGDPYAAQALNKQLQKQANLPPLVRQQVKLNQKQLNKLLNSFNHQLSLSTGYDSNLNTSSGLSTITLPLFGPLPLDEVRQGPTLRLGATTRYTQRQATSQQSLQLAINSRLTENNQDNQHQLTISYQHHNQLVSGNQLKHQLTLLGLNHGGSHIYTSLEAQQQWQTTNSNTCQFSPSHSINYQRFPNYKNRYLDALEYRLTPEVNCQLNRHQIKLSASGLYNHALNTNRPGSHRHGLELTASWQHPLGKGSLALQGRQTHWQDQDKALDILGNKTKRTIKRQQLALVYLLPLSPSLQLSSQASWQQQTSNLELFEFKSHQLELGLRWYF